MRKPYWTFAQASDELKKARDEYYGHIYTCGKCCYLIKCSDAIKLNKIYSALCTKEIESGEIQHRAYTG